VRNADQIKLAELALQRYELMERAKAGRLRPSDIAGATFTISNLGMYEVDAFSAIISSPQAAILAVGSIADRVVPFQGTPAIRPIMTLTLSCDHRVVDGARAAMFMNEVVGAFHEPGKWLERRRPGSLVPANNGGWAKWACKHNSCQMRWERFVRRLKYTDRKSV
jgi:pyruvate dehydrogenase E2 component (dihydrolipoamide acetyltransferase)